MSMLKSLLLIFFLSIQVTGFSQATVTIKFDFATKTITSPADLSTIKNGDYVIIEISNFNPYLYQAQIAFTDSTIPVNTAPALFSSFFNTADLTSLVANLGSSVLKIFPGAPPPAAAGPALLTKRDSINAITRIIQAHKNEIKVRQTELSDLIQKIQVFTFDQNIRMLVVKKWNLKASDITDFTGSDQTNYVTAVKGFFNERNTIRGNILSEIGNYESNAIVYGKYLKEDPVLRAADSLTKISNRELMQSIGAFDTTFTFSKFESILAQLINLNKENIKYTSLPTQITSDIKKIDLSILPWNTSSNLSSYKASWQFPSIQKSYFNFSTDFYFSGMHDENYFAEQQVNAPGDTSYSISKEGTGSVEVGVAALLHYGWYFKGKNNASFQVNFGPGLSIQKNPQPRLFAGIGAGIGRKNKILISTGAIVGEVQRLRNFYQAKPTVKFPPSDLTTHTLKANIFISVGYAIL